MNELISIIVPVYNVKEYLEKCVDSILNQTYKNIEIILINDGSTDGSKELCDEIAKKDDRIMVIHKENGGVSETRNIGIDKSKGEYISFVDSDDYITPDFCETLYKALKENNADISSVKFRMVRENGEKIYEPGEDINSLSIIETNVYEGNEIIKETLLMKSFKSYACTKLYKKELLQNNRFKVGTNYEDLLFNYEVMKKANILAYINKECYFYLKRRNSITATCSEKNLNDFIDIVIYKYNDLNHKIPEYKIYNIYTLIYSLISIGIKYVIANDKFDLIEEKMDYLINEIRNYVKNNEVEINHMLDEFQKASLYLMLYDKELYLKFLNNRQEKNRMK